MHTAHALRTYGNSKGTVRRHRESDLRQQCVYPISDVLSWMPLPEDLKAAALSSHMCLQSLVYPEAALQSGWERPRRQTPLCTQWTALCSDVAGCQHHCQVVLPDGRGILGFHWVIKPKCPQHA